MMKQSFTAEPLYIHFCNSEAGAAPPFPAGETEVWGSQGKDFNSHLFIRGHSCGCFHLESFIPPSICSSRQQTSMEHLLRAQPCSGH